MLVTRGVADLRNVCRFDLGAGVMPGPRADWGSVAAVGTKSTAHRLSGSRGTGPAGKALGPNFRSLHVAGDGGIPRVPADALSSPFDQRAKCVYGV